MISMNELVESDCAEDIEKRKLMCLHWAAERGYWCYASMPFANLFALNEDVSKFLCASPAGFWANF